jgi:magnesium transporter
MKSPAGRVPKEHLGRSVAEFLSPGPPPLLAEQTIGQALDSIRVSGLKGRIFYFYVVDSQGCLCGVVPSRKLLTESVDSMISDVMMRRVLSLPESATLMEACECFILHKFLAIPVVDQKKTFRGIVDVGLFTEEVLELHAGNNNDQLFQSIGIHVQEAVHASPWKAFGIRFPWLAATVSGGVLCAFLAGAFASTLRERVVLAVFMALVLGLGEAVAAQSLALTVQSLPVSRIRWKWLRMKLVRESMTAFLLGILAGVSVGLMVWICWHDPLAAIAMAFSVLLSIVVAGILGVLVPATIRMVRWDPKIASGPITLATADLFTVTCYLVTARILLG